MRDVKEPRRWYIENVGGDIAVNPYVDSFEEVVEASALDAANAEINQLIYELDKSRDSHIKIIATLQAKLNRYTNIGVTPERLRQALDNEDALQSEVTELRNKLEVAVGALTEIQNCNCNCNSEENAEDALALIQAPQTEEK